MKNVSNTQIFISCSFFLFPFVGISASSARSPSVTGSCKPAWDEQFGVPGLVSPTNPALSRVFAVLTMNDPSTGNPALFATGGFLEAGGSVAYQIAKWDGRTWSSLGDGLGGDPSLAGLALSGFEPYGSELYAGGLFFEWGEAPGNNIARWDGTSWSRLGDGLNERVEAITVLNDELYVGGRFTMAGNNPARRIAKWDGQQWSALGGGVSGQDVFAIEVFDDGTGPAVYAAGTFFFAYNCPNMGCPVEVNHIAKWDGAQWSALGEGLELKSSGEAWEMEVFDDGTGPALYVGGQFEAAGGVPLSGIARWDGQSWSAVGEGIAGWVRALTVFDDGTGPALFAGGLFSTAGDEPANSIAKWDGESWTPLGEGIDLLVWGLAGLDDGNVRALYAGGDFNTAGGAPANNIARWITCPVELPGDFDEDGDVDRFDFAAYLACYSGPGGNISLSCRAFDFDADEDVDRHDFAVFQRAFTGP